MSDATKRVYTSGPLTGQTTTIASATYADLQNTLENVAIRQGATTQAATLGSTAIQDGASNATTALRGLGSSGLETGVTRGARLLSVASKTLPALRLFGVVGLGVTAGQLGWKIGTKFFKWTHPAAPASGPPGHGSYTFTDWEMEPIAQGATDANGVPAPFEGYYLDYNLRSSGSVIDRQANVAQTTLCYEFPDVPAFPEVTVGGFGFYAKTTGYGSCHWASDGTTSQKIGAVFSTGSQFDSTPVHTYDAGTDGTPDATRSAPSSASTTDLDNGVATAVADPIAAPTIDYIINKSALVPATIAPPDPTKILVLAPASHETFAQYQTRLAAEGLLGTITRSDLSDAQTDPARGPNEAVRTSPAAGTEVAPSTDVTVYTNPDSAPDPAGGSGPFGAPTIPAIDLSPLNVTAGCTTFPFGVPCWLSGAVGGFGGTGHCPVFDFPLPTYSKHIHVDLCTIQPAVDVVRPVFLIGSLLGLAWLFMGAAMGFGGSAGKED
jgi:hypothetical protein